MFDDLRNTAVTVYEEDEQEAAASTQPVETARPPFLGMTAVQRFVVAVLLFLMVLILCAFLLLLADKITLPFY